MTKLFVEHPGYTGSVKDQPAKVWTYGLVIHGYKTTSAYDKCRIIFIDFLKEK